MRELIKKLQQALSQSLPFLFLLFVTVLFFNQIVFQDKIFVTGDFLRSDTLNQNLPFKYSLYESLRSGSFPLWTDKIFTGFPLFAEGQVGSLYPYNLVLFSTLSFVQAYNLTQVFNFLTAFFGMYVLVRYLGVSRLSSVFSSIAFGLSGFLVVHITHQNIVASSVWLPLLFYAVLRFFDSGKYKFALLGSAILAIQVFAGSLQMVLYSAFSVFLFLHIKLFLDRGKEIGKYVERIIVWSIKFSGIILFGILLSAIQFFPTLELVGESTRAAGLGNIALDSLPYHPRNLITFILPYYFGDPGLGTYSRFGGNWGMFWENTGYVGFLTLVFAGVTVFLWKKQRILVVPFLILFAVSILLTLGKYSPTSFVFHLPGFNSFRVPSRFLLISTFSLAVLAGIGLDHLRSKLRSRSLISWVVAIFILVLLFDLFKFGYQYNPVVDGERVLSPPQILEVVEADVDFPSRIYSIGSTQTYDKINERSGWRNNQDLVVNHMNALDANINMLFDVSSSGGYSGLFLQRNTLFESRVRAGIGIGEQTATISEDSLKLLGLQNVGYLISAYNLKGEGLELIGKTNFSDINYYAYKNEYVLPRAFYINSTDANVVPGIFEKINGEANLKTVSTTNLQLMAQMENPGWLIVSDSYYPGWEAWVDGQKTKVHIAAGLFKAVYLTKGDHNVEFIYRPGSFLWGRVISISALLFLIVFLVRKLNTKKLRN